VEAEIKIPIDSISVDEDLVSYIIQIMGPPLEEIIQIDTYFQSPVNDFYQTDEALRIRRILFENKEERIELTYKGPKQGKEMKIREEVNLEVNQYSEAIKLFQRLGFSVVKDISKKRTNWYKKPITLSFDEVKGLGKYIEAEIITINSQEDLTSEKRRLYNFIREIFPTWNGYNERKSYLELLMQKQEE
jgi:adenylate cyclase class 2